MTDEIMQSIKEVEILEKIRARNNNAELIIKPNQIILNFNYPEQNITKTLEISKEDNKFKVHILPNNITRTIDLEELENIIIALEKQKDDKRLSENEVNQIKQKYPKGTKIELIKMYDYLDPVEPHTKGKVDYVDDIGQIHVIWENDRTLALNERIDEFKVVPNITEESEDIYTEYRNRLLKKEVDILLLEIYETFAGSGFIDNTLDFVQLLETKDDEAILKELYEIKNNIFKTKTDRYLLSEKIGYKRIVEGYILRLECRRSK